MAADRDGSVGVGRPFDLVIFDCDGVLVDSEAIAASTLARFLTIRGVRTDLAYVMRNYLGRSFATIEADFLARTGRAAPERFAEEWYAELFDAFRRGLKPIDGVPELLTRLAIPKCVASSSAPARLTLSLDVTGLAPKFGANVFDASMVKRGKPAPDLFLYCAERMGVAPSRTLVVEDSVSGIASAVAAGMTAWGFAGGAHYAPGMGVDARSLQSAGARRIFSSMAEFGLM